RGRQFGLFEVVGRDDGDALAGQVGELAHTYDANSAIACGQFERGVDCTPDLLGIDTRVERLGRGAPAQRRDRLLACPRLRIGPAQGGLHALPELAVPHAAEACAPAREIGETVARSAASSSSSSELTSSRTL